MNKIELDEREAKILLYSLEQSKDITKKTYGERDYFEIKNKIKELI